MAAFYREFTRNKPNDADYNSLFNSLRALDPTVGIQHDPSTLLYKLKKNTAWLAAHITAAQTEIDNAPDASPQLTAAGSIDELSIAQQATILAIIDEINILRAQHSLAPRTPQQAYQAIKDKAMTLS